MDRSMQRRHSYPAWVGEPVALLGAAHVAEQHRRPPHGGSAVAAATAEQPVAELTWSSAGEDTTTVTGTIADAITAVEAHGQPRTLRLTLHAAGVRAVVVWGGYTSACTLLVDGDPERVPDLDRDLDAFLRLGAPRLGFLHLPVSRLLSLALVYIVMFASLGVTATRIGDSVLVIPVLAADIGSFAASCWLLVTAPRFVMREHVLQDRDALQRRWLARLLLSGAVPLVLLAAVLLAR